MPENMVENLKKRKQLLLDQANDYKTKARIMEQDAEDIQTQIEKITFFGKTYSQYVDGLNGTEKDIDDIKIEIREYKIYIYHMAGKVKLIYKTSVHAENIHYLTTAIYPESTKYKAGREVIYGNKQPIPKKYKDMFDKMKTTADSFKVTKP